MHYSLGKRRLDEITADVAAGGYFPCHKTTGPRHAAEQEAGGWDKVDTLDKLMIVAKEQECFGARNWRLTSGWLEDGIDPEV